VVVVDKIELAANVPTLMFCPTIPRFAFVMKVLNRHIERVFNRDHKTIIGESGSSSGTNEPVPAH
jgi:hypothetical protein